jgi:flagellar protein FlaJ
LSEGKRKRLVDALREKVLDSGIARRIAYGVVTNKWVVIAAAIADSLAIYYLTTYLPHPLNLVLGAFVVVGTFLVLFYFRALKRVGLIPVSDDLAFILVHMRCLVTGNPPLTTLFARIGEAPFYKRRYSGLFQKLRGLIKNWGYSAPEALKLVSREAPSKVDEMFLQRFSAIVATGGDVKEYLRIEYNTLFAEYLSAFNRVINVLRVVFGVYTTVMGALVFMMANLMLLGMLFGGISSTPNHWGLEHRPRANGHGRPDVRLHAKASLRV